MRTDPGVTVYTAYWVGSPGAQETRQHGVGMLFAALRRGWPWVHRVGGDVEVIVSPINVPGSQPRGPRVAPPPPRVPSGISRQEPSDSSKGASA